MGWGEAWRLVLELLQDPSAHITAAVLEWDYPVTREWLVLASMRDAVVASNFKDPKPWPLPWRSEADGRTEGTAAEQVLDQEQILSALKKAAGR